MRAVGLLLLALCLMPSLALSAQRGKVAFPPRHPLTADCVPDAARVSGMPDAVPRDGRVRDRLNKLRQEGLSMLPLQTTETRP